MNLINRSFYRCAGCLAVIAVDGVSAAAKCGACGSSLESMGNVHMAEKVKVSGGCNCDARCTHAKGPKCDCRCRGQNHGAGLVVIASGLDAMPSDHLEAKGRFNEFENAVQDLESWSAGRKVGDRLRAEWVLSKAKASRQHKHRMKLIRDFRVGALAGEEEPPFLELL